MDSAVLLPLDELNADRDVKPVVLACLGDIALAIQGEFRQYLEVRDRPASVGWFPSRAAYRRLSVDRDAIAVAVEHAVPRLDIVHGGSYLCSDDDTGDRF